jgi:protein MpaA
MPFSSFSFIFTLFIIISPALYADNSQLFMGELCREVGDKLANVSMRNCLQQKMIVDAQRSQQQRVIPYKIYPPVSDSKPLGRVLLMGGIHDDEYSTASTVFKWMDTLNEYHSGLFHWQVTPLMTPDSLLTEGHARRQNSRRVDLNRNLSSKDWDDLAFKYWEKRMQKNPCRYSGFYASGEPETQRLVSTVQ